MRRKGSKRTERKVCMDEEKTSVERGFSELKPQIMEKIKHLFCKAEKV